MNNAVYFQSGGPTSVINSSFYGVIKACKESNKIDNLYGSLYGIDGLLKDNLVLIDKDINEYQELTNMNGAILGTCRKCLSNDEELKTIVNTLNKYSIKCVFVNGGNDSMDTCNKMNIYFKENNIDCVAVGIPKTIDNDLELTDHCPGFGSNVKYVVRSLMEIFLDINSYDKGRVTIVEVMGRETGWLTASSICAKLFNLGPDLIYVPEVAFDIEKFLSDCKRIYDSKKKVLVVVAEALKDKDGNYISINQSLDSFGHIQLGSVSFELAKLVKERLNINTRNIEFSLTQRSASHIISTVDKNEAIEVGSLAVKFALENKRGMVGIIRDSDSPYKVHYDLFPIDKIANKIKYLPKKFINNEGNYINDSFIDYCLPFIDKEEIEIKSGHLFI